jgi:hypothetical protein
MSNIAIPEQLLRQRPEYQAYIRAQQSGSLKPLTIAQQRESEKAQRYNSLTQEQKDLITSKSKELSSLSPKDYESAFSALPDYAKEFFTTPQEISKQYNQFIDTKYQEATSKINARINELKNYIKDQENYKKGLIDDGRRGDDRVGEASNRIREAQAELNQWQAPLNKDKETLVNEYFSGYTEQVASYYRNYEESKSDRRESRERASKKTKELIKKSGGVIGNVSMFSKGAYEDFIKQSTYDKDTGMLKIGKVYFNPQQQVQFKDSSGKGFTTTPSKDIAYRAGIFNWGYRVGYEKLPEYAKDIISPEINKYLKTNDNYKVIFSKDKEGAISAELKPIPQTDTKEITYDSTPIEPDYLSGKKYKSEYELPVTMPSTVKDLNITLPSNYSGQLSNRILSGTDYRVDTRLPGSTSDRDKSSNFIAGFLSGSKEGYEKTVIGGIEFAKADIPTGTVLPKEQSKTLQEYKEPMPISINPIANWKAGVGKDMVTIDLDSDVYGITKQKTIAQKALLNHVPDTVESATSTAAGLLLLGGVSSIAPKVRLGLAVSTLGYGGYQSLAGKTQEEKAAGLATVGLGLAGFAYAGVKFARAPKIIRKDIIIKKPVPERPKLLIEREKNQLGVYTEEGGIETVNIAGRAYNVEAGSKTTVTTNIRNALGLKPLYKGTYLEDKKGYEAALKKLMKYKYSEYQARQILRERAPKFEQITFFGQAKITTKENKPAIIDLRGAKIIKSNAINLLGYKTKPYKKIKAIISKGEEVPSTREGIEGTVSNTLEIGEVKRGHISGQLTVDKTLSKKIAELSVGEKNIKKLFAVTNYRKLGTKKVKTSTADVYILGESPQVKIPGEEAKVTFDLVKPEPAKDTISLFHGTSDKFVGKILKEGLLPASKTGVSSSGTGEIRDFVSLGMSPEVSGFGTRTVLKKGGKLKIIEANIPKSELEQLKVTSDKLSGSNQEIRVKEVPAKYLRIYNPKRVRSASALESKTVQENLASRAGSILKTTTRKVPRPLIDKFKVKYNTEQASLLGTKLFDKSRGDSQETENKQKLRTATVPILDYSQSTYSEQSQEQRQDNVQLVRLSQPQASKQQTVQAQIPNITPKITMPGESTYIKERITTTPPTVIDFDFRKKEKLVKQQPYNAYVYVESTKGSKARYEQINTKPLTLGSALSAMARVVDNTISARGKVSIAKPKEVNGKKITVAVDTRDRYYEQNKEKFRTYKTAKKLPLPTGTVIERQRYRLDKPQETKQITSAKRTPFGF